jgi:hypothetical protein
MNNPITFLRWSGILAVVALVGIFLYRPHYLGLAENPDIRIMTDDVLISGKSFKDQKSKELHAEYGCKFWKYQEQALDSAIKRNDLLMQINIDAKEKATTFIKSYAEMKSELESKHLANKKTDEHKFLTTIRQGEIKSLERDLEKNKKELEYIPPLLEGLTTSKIELEVDKVIVFDMASQCVNQPK